MMDSPLKDWLFVIGIKDGGYNGNGNHATFHARKPGGESFGSIFCRRVQDATVGYVAPDGRFFCRGWGDVWEGDIEITPSDPQNIGELVAARLAPMAICNTDASYLLTAPNDP